MWINSFLISRLLHSPLSFEFVAAMATPQPLHSSTMQRHGSSNGYLANRSLVLSVAKILMLSLSQLPLAQAYPVPWILTALMTQDEKEGPMPSSSPTLWIYLVVAMSLVLLGGAFAGLTIALMGQVCLTILART